MSGATGSAEVLALVRECEVSDATDVIPPRVRLNLRQFDTSRWDHVRLRDDDIIVATWAKTGTTLTQQMVYQLITGGGEDVASVSISPWVELRYGAPVESMAEMLESQTHRRVLKTHSSFEAVPLSESIKYIYVGRDARDVLWSAYNHVTSFTDAARKASDAREGPWQKRRVPDEDVRTYYLHWLENDNKESFHELSFWDHVQGWWDQRQRPNLLLLHYANLIADLTGEMRRLAAFLKIPIDEARLPLQVERCGIDYMRNKARGTHLDVPFKEGSTSFFHKGTNGRWRDVLSPEESARCDEVAAQRLTPDCAHWLKTGEIR